MSTHPIKIYVADDEKNIRDIICLFLNNEGYEVSTFENGDLLLDAFHACPADMVILDLMMPGRDGLEICSLIRQTHLVPIIIVSARDSEIDRITGITMGSDDYLVKPFSPMELVARVKAIFRRIQIERQNASINPYAFGEMTLDLNTRLCLFRNEPIDLTPTEFSLMTYMFENSQRAISREELLKNVWKFDFEVDTRATDNTLKRLRKKLNPTTVRITSVWGFGFKLELTDGDDS